MEIKSRIVLSAFGAAPVVRCGTCCLKGGPTLHLEDVGMLENSIIRRADLYTIRQGETVFNNIEGKTRVLAEEMIKIKGTEERYSCIFYDDIQKGCTIYANRPIECRVLKCWDTKEIKAISGKSTLCRQHLIPPNTPLAHIIAAHEQRCAYMMIETWIRKIGGPDATKAVEKIIGALQFDHYLRPFIAKKSELPIEEMDFFFGRPLTTTINMFGLQVTQEGDIFLLTPMENNTR
jgi:Fe-S-cluster containining protein